MLAILPQKFVLTSHVNSWLELIKHFLQVTLLLSFFTEDVVSEYVAVLAFGYGLRWQMALIQQLRLS